MTASLNRNSFFLLVAVLLLFGVFYSPPIENRTEAEDAFTYALEVEKLRYHELLHSSHRLYHPVAKGVFKLSGFKRSFDALVIFSSVLSGCALCVFYFLVKNLTKTGNWQSLAWTTCLAFSYGFWRYGREVEVYAMGWLVCLLVLTLLFAWKKTNPWVRGIVYAVGVIVALNVHRALGPPLLIIGLVYFFSQRQWLVGSGSLGLGLLLYLACEIGAENLPAKNFALESRGEVGEFFVEELKVDRKSFSKRRSLELSSLPKGAVGLGVCLFGGNVLMTSDTVYKFFSETLFPYRFLEEEKMMVHGYSPLWMVFWCVGVILFFLLAGIAVRFTYRSIRIEGWSNDSELWAVLVGLGCYLAMIVIFEPGNPEMWLLGLPLVWLALALWLQRFPLCRVWMLGGVLIVTNYIGGMLFLANKNNDYHYVTSRTVREEAVSGDIYLMGTLNPVHARYVRYAVDVEVAIVKVGDRRIEEFYNLVNQKIQQGRRVFVHESLPMGDLKFEEYITRAGLIFEESEKGRAKEGELLLRRNG